jgi:hypothetical protein
VRDVYAAARVRITEEQLAGFTVGATEVVLRGLCDTCSSNSDQRKQEPNA